MISKNLSIKAIANYGRVCSANTLQDIIQQIDSIITKYDCTWKSSNELNYKALTNLKDEIKTYLEILKKRQNKYG